MIYEAPVNLHLVDHKFFSKVQINRQNYSHSEYMFSFCIVYLRERMMMIIQSITQEQRKTETSFERISLYLEFWHSSSKCLNVKLLASKRWVVSRLPYVHLRYFVSICTSSSLLRCSWKTHNWGWHFKQSMTLHHT